MRPRTVRRLALLTGSLALGSLLALAPSLSAARARLHRVSLTPPPSVLAVSPLKKDVVHTPSERGMYLGPVWVDGNVAKVVRKLPDNVQTQLQRPVAVGPMGFPWGAGAGLYGRLPRTF